MDREKYLSIDFLTMPPANSHEELETPPPGIEYAQSFDKARSNTVEPYFFFYMNGRWTKESELVNVSDMNDKINVANSWNSALSSCVSEINTVDKDHFTKDEVLSIVSALFKP